MSTLAVESRPLSITGIRRRLRAPTVGRQIYLYGRVESTNDTLARLARSGAPEGTVVIAEAQTAGRGRLGQPWFSPPKVNLYASVLFRGPLALKDAPVFSLIGGLAVAEAVRDAGATPAIKWPNDVLVDRSSTWSSGWVPTSTWISTPSARPSGPPPTMRRRFAP